MSVEELIPDDHNESSVLDILKTDPPPDALPDGWIVHQSRSQPGYGYYYNQFTGERRWELEETIENLANIAQKHVANAAKAKKAEDPQLQQSQPPPQEGSSVRSILKRDAAGQESSAPHPAKPETSPKKRQRSGEEGKPHAHSRSPPLEKKPRSSGRSSGKPEKVRVLHILKKHNKSRRPSSWRLAAITISKEEAIEELKELMSILKETEGDPKELRATFEELAKTESDCSSAKRGGDLGFFGRRKMQPNFETASFALEIGKLSGIVETNSGIHVILRLG
mmetsp:Transcript_19802/g.28907  ORF Transcript_19802/g.28907 Transcript_19802/m.28907 type:complete len:280 (-) Transcript_19802:828-1667(-)|eukprot:CAMPEP_0197243222 /NCGR_PEP_ID=MMETSP1429-20130617/8739_1 /TAXON_ID=49237 /ORGANISM="Chaetoceros  sp., Strain UNC1202" /LENGTH=279 /DNA_ID=CAMNT_0042703399 /DNA_START=110 /DNA_END=949 /DNA_ORIENTATION=-